MKHKAKIRGLFILVGLCKVVEGLACVLTLSFYRPMVGDKFSRDIVNMQVREAHRLREVL